MKPKLSVVMPVHNCAEFVGETIISILDQSFADFEFLIVDDNSTDNSVEAIKAFHDSRIKLQRSEKPGCANAYNTGIKNSSADIIAFIDHDDVAARDRFINQYSFLHLHNEIDLTGCWYNIISENGRLLCTVRNPVPDSEIKRELLRRNCIINSGLMIRKSVFGKLGSFNQNYYPVHDYEFLLRVSNQTTMHNLPEVLHNWRSRRSSPSNIEADAMRKAAVSLAGIYNQQEYSAGKISRGEYYFRTGRSVYYNDSPVRSAKYFMQSLIARNTSAENLRCLFLSIICFPLIWLYRNSLIKYRYGGFVSYHI